MSKGAFHSGAAHGVADLLAAVVDRGLDDDGDRDLEDVLDEMTGPAGRALVDELDRAIAKSQLRWFMDGRSLGVEAISNQVTILHTELDLLRQRLGVEAGRPARPTGL